MVHNPNRVVAKFFRERPACQHLFYIVDTPIVGDGNAEFHMRLIAPLSICITDYVSHKSRIIAGTHSDIQGACELLNRWFFSQHPTAQLIRAQQTSAASFILNLLGNVLLVLIAAAFLAANPDLYRRGALKLVPPEQRQIVGDTMMDSGAALKQWLLGQLIAMAIVGTLTGVGLWLVGLPSPVALGLIAALAEFVPILGPILGAIPAILLAMTVDTQTVLWTIGVIVVIQQLESNMITPLIQQRMASLPPVLTIFAVLCFGLLFGPLGLLLATPLAVLTLVLVTRLYIRELLEEPTQVPGEKEAARERAKEAAAAG
jgi:predicted PurR-regulated permease PerM